MQMTLSVFINGDDLDPSCVTHCLDVIPTSLQKKGDLKPRKQGSPYIVRNGSWIYTLKGEGDNQAINDIFLKMENIFKNELSKVSKIENVTNSWIDLLIFMTESEKSDGAANFRLDENSLAFLANSKLPFEISIYIDDECDL